MKIISVLGTLILVGLLIRLSVSYRTYDEEKESFEKILPILNKHEFDICFKEKNKLIFWNKFIDKKDTLDQKNVNILEMNFLYIKKLGKESYFFVLGGAIDERYGLLYSGSNCVNINSFLNLRSIDSFWYFCYSN
ncbi:MAG: hypothetical protein K8R79_03375 [Calditrichales bacterium]|nr:hypothetical protein [Calditrichales bacterium]